MELQAGLDAAEVNRQLQRTTKRPTGAARKMAVGDIGEPETARGGQPRGTDQSIDTRPRRHAKACHRADWSGVYELSKNCTGLTAPR